LKKKKKLQPINCTTDLMGCTGRVHAIARRRHKTSTSSRNRMKLLPVMAAALPSFVTDNISQGFP
jgi:hypothetical protein